MTISDMHTKLKGTLSSLGQETVLRDRMQAIVSRLGKLIDTHGRDKVDEYIAKLVRKGEFNDTGVIQQLEGYLNRIDKSIQEGISGAGSESTKPGSNSDENSNQAKSDKNSKVAGAAAIITLVLSVLALVVGLVASFFVEDKDTLFFAIEGTKDIWNAVCDGVTILCPFCGIGSVISGAKSFKQTSGIKFRLTLSICSAIVIGITCVLIAFRAFGQNTWIAATVLFVVFLSIMVWCVVSLPKHEGEVHEEK